jgi:hypothetical protein
MGLRILVANVLVLAGVIWMVASGSETRAAGLLPHPAAATSNVGNLEARAALEPTISSVADLAGAYLDRGQPGLAEAVIERAPQAIRRQPALQQLYARVLYHRGLSREALSIAREVRAGCEEGATSCPPWLAAKTVRQVAFLEEIVAAGIEDPLADPRATARAYERSTRHVQMVAMR